MFNFGKKQVRKTEIELRVEAMKEFDKVFENLEKHTKQLMEQNEKTMNKIKRLQKQEG